ncbi:phosphoglycerate dehydrogenase [Cupriavidus gilardii]|uniref:phosphoglycerate dehydrogenase n=1 Tax=Cupriavidus gilardii TaxID=82541 RepID=UPI0015805509|nr:phosphoglycerate dehydrogenase [Cupriavidus gilardii]MCT9071639.1 phosphoglycerate dehydrogenase [Cupriavidus gilardii]QKS61700.1 phosphoglycerate dehydrogenase [Cupriavidus gilardii]
MTKVMLLENIHESASERLAEAGLQVDRRAGALAGGELHEVLAANELIGIRSATHLHAEDIRHAGNLLSIGCFCIGTSQVDLAAATAAGIPVFNAPFSNTRSVAELVVSEAVMLLRRIPEKNTLAHAGKWAKGAAGAFEARGKTLAIVGYGNIGSQVGVLAEAMGMRVVYYDVQPRLSLGSAKAAGSLADAVAHADVVTLHVPATPRTRNMIDATVLAAFKRGAMLINASRGSVVDIPALAEALREGRLGGAAIDVFPSEPKNNKDAFVSELQNLPNVLLTPHIGGSTEEAQQNIGVEVAAKLVNYMTTGATIGAVNFPEVDPGPVDCPARLLNVHGNAPGALAALNTLLAREGINIAGQHLETRGTTGYVVTDLDKAPSAELEQALAALPGVLRLRVLRREEAGVAGAAS